MGTETDRTVAVRRASEADERPCAELYLEERRRTHPWQPADRFGLDDYRRVTTVAEVIVADTGRRVVGFVAIDRIEHIVRALFVAEDWRHRGIGSELLQHAVRHLEGKARLECDERNGEARAFYERRGWVEDDRPRTGHAPLVLYRATTETPAPARGDGDTSLFSVSLLR